MFTAAEQLGSPPCLSIRNVFIMEMLILMVVLFFAWPFILVYRLFTGDRAMPPKDRIICMTAMIVLCGCCLAEAGPFRRSGIGHNALVAQSGITPRQVGTHEGVGMSTRSYIDARNNACYWGKRTPVSIQYSKKGNRYYAVVRYR